MKSLATAVASILGFSSLGLAHAGVSDIVKDDRTETEIIEAGDTYTITTSTISGANAFNSFKTFDLAQTDTVNLVLPDSTSNLINLVWDSQALINGTLNSYFASAPGVTAGNVFFADPHGVVVGSTGSINVGALSLSAPSTGFMCGLLNDNGGPTCSTLGEPAPVIPLLDSFKVNVTAAGFTQLLQGSEPLATGSKIDIQGAIHAANAVRVRAQAIDVSGTIFVSGDGAGGFETAVNLGDSGTPTIVTDGNTIRLVADASDSASSGDSNATAAVNVTGGLYAGYDTSDTTSGGTAGGSIVVSAHADASSAYGTAAGESTNDELLTKQAEDLISSKTSVFSSKKLGTFGYVRANSTATVNLGGTAVLAATDDVELTSSVKTSATTLATVATKKKKGAKARAGNRGNFGVAIAAMYGSVTGNATTDVASGATVRVGDAFSVNALTDNTLNVAATTIAKTGEKGVATLAWSNADVHATANVASGSTVEAGGAVSVIARNTNNFSTAATTSVVSKKGKDGKEANGGKVGLAAAISIQNVQATASNGADLNGVDSLVVDANTLTQSNSTVAATAFSSRKAKGTANSKQATQANLSDNSLANSKGKSNFKVGAAIAWTDSNLTATASLADNAAITADGDVTVHARVVDGGIGNSATSSAVSKSKSSGSETSITAGIAVGQYTHDAQALVGKNASITASRIGVGSQVVLPFNWGEDNADAFGVLGTMWSDVGSFVEGVNTLANDVNVDYVAGLTSYAGASAKSKSPDSKAISGSVNWFEVTNTSKAWVDAGASLTATGAVADTGWSSTLDDGTLVDWGDAIAVAASTDLTSVNAVGDIEIFALAKTILKGAEANTAIGGAFNTVQFDNTTSAGVAADAVLTADKAGVDVSAHSVNNIVAISPVAGKGGENAISGTLALTDIDDKTQASISHDAKVTAERVGVDAHADMMVWAISGALAMSDTASVGLGVGVNQIDTDTRAWIGDNEGGLPGGTDGVPGVASGSGYVHASELAVTARTQGQAGAITVSGTSTGGKSKNKAGDNTDSKTTTATTKQNNAVAGKAGDSSKSSGLISKAGGTGGDTAAKGGKFGLNISGAASVNLATLETRAYLQGADIAGKGAGSNSTTVLAINQAELTSVAGSAAITRSGSKSDGQKFSATIAGAVAYTDIGNVTAGYIQDSTLDNADKVAVRALNAGEQLDIGIGIGSSGSTGKEPSATLAGSVSVAQTANETSAYIGNSSVHGSAGGSKRSLDVTAYDRSRIGVGGGSLVVSTGKNKSNGSAALALTYADIGNTTKAGITGHVGSASDWDVDNYDALTVRALDSSLIGAGALAAVIGNKNSNSLAGAFIWNDIGNTTSVFVDEGARLQIGGDVNLTAASTTPVDELDDLIDAAGIANSSNYDFGGEVLADNAADNKTANGSPSDPDAPNIDTLTEGGYGSSIIAVAGAVQSGKNNVGLSFVGSQVANTHEVSVVGAEIDVGTHSVALNANDNTRIISLAVGGGVSQGSFAGTGSMTYNDIGNTDRVVVGDASGLVDTSIMAGAIDMGASDTSRIYSLAGNIAVSKKVAVGGALTWNKIHNTVESHATHATLTADAGTVDIGADNDALIMAGAVAGAVSTQSSGAAVGLAFGWNEGASSTTAKLDGATTVDAGSLNLVADNGTSIYTLSGGVGIGGSVGVGAAANVADIHDTTTASLQNVGLDIDNAVDLFATGSGEAYSLAVGLAISKNAAVAASSTNNIIDNTVSAKASNLSGFNATSHILTGAAQASTLDIAATNTAGAYALAGSVGGASTAGIGAAFATNVIEGKTEALLQDSVLAVSDSVDVDSTFDAVIQSAAIAGSGGGTAAVSGSSTINFITSDVEAGISNSGLDEAGNETSVQATDTSRIDSLAGSIAVGGTAGVGAAVAVNRIGTQVNAWMEGGVDDRTWHAQNVTVQAEAGISDSGLTASPGGNINTIAVGGAGGGTAAVAGSLAVNLMDGEVHARIGDAADTALAADVVAEHNVGVLADSEQGINVFAGAVAIGGTAGVGVGVVVNSIQGDTGASIEGGSQVTALALDDTDTLAVSSGKLVDEDALNFSILGAGARNIDELVDPANYVAPDLAMQTTDVTGVAVNASNRQHIATLGVAASGSGTVAVSAMGSINLVGGETFATIDNASINQARQGDAAAGQQVDVRAASHQMEANFSIGVAGGVVAVGGAVASNVFNSNTQARIDNSTTDAKSDVVVAANAGQGSLALAVGGTAGAAAGAASGTITIFDTTTLARVKGGSLASDNLDVTAANSGWNTMLAGALSGGGSAFSGAFLVNVAQSETTAKVDDVGSLDLDGELNIDAGTYNASQAVGVSGALGGGGGAVAGVGIVNVIKNTTTAELSDSTVVQADAVTVQASEEQAMDIVSGALAVDFGGVGVGAGINVTVLQSTVDATIGNSSVTSTGAVNVDADAIRDIDALGVAGGGGLLAGAGVAASLIIAGAGDATVDNDGTQRDSMDDLNKEGNVDRLGSFTGGDRVDSDLAGSKDNQLKQGDIDAINGASDFDLAAALNENNGSYGRADGISAGIAGSTINAQSLVVDAASDTATSNVVGGVGVGGFAGVGGALAYTGLYTEVNADIDGTSTVTVDDGITVNAGAGNHGGNAAVDVNAYQGAGGLVGLGAAVAIGRADTNVNANVAGNLTAGYIDIKAQDHVSVDVEARGYTVGLVAAGAVIARANKEGETAVGVGLLDGTTSKLTAAGNLTAGSSRDGRVKAYSQAGAGGVVAGSGSDSAASATGSVGTHIGNNVEVIADNTILTASATPTVGARAEGFGGALIANVGVALAKAEATTDVLVDTGTNTSFSGGSLMLGASVNLGSTHTTNAYSEAAGGGLLLGVNATNSTASTGGVVSAYLENATLTMSGDVTVSATRDSQQRSVTHGYNGGLVALGGSTANARSTGSIESGLTGVHGTIGGTLKVSTDGKDDNYAETLSGSGGVIAGSVAKANSSDHTNASAQLGGGSATTPLHAEKIAVEAAHAAQVNSHVSSVQAAVAGMSGAIAQNTVGSTITASVLDQSNITTRDLTMSAHSTVLKPWLANDGQNAQAAAGGLFAGPAAKSSTDVSVDSTTRIGNDAKVVVEGNKDDPGATDLSAYNDITLYDRSKLDSGGVVAVARADSNLRVNHAGATVKLAENASLDTVGRASLSAWNNATLEAHANTKTYGLAGGAQGYTVAYVDSSSLVDIDQGVKIRADGDVDLNAGRNSSGTENRIRAVARTDVFNKTAFPVSLLDATATILQSDKIVTDAGSIVSSVGNINLTATPGNTYAQGKAIGKDLYRELAAEVASAFSNLVGGGDVSLDIEKGSSTNNASAGVHVDGQMLAGIQNKQFLRIDKDGDILEQSEGITCSTPGCVPQEFDYAKDIMGQIEKYQELLVEYQQDVHARTAFEAELRRLKLKLVTLGLGEVYREENGVLVKDPDGDIIYATKDLKVDLIEIDPVLAQGGDINVVADYLSGSGSLSAPRDAQIKIENASKAFLRITGLTIPADKGGHLRLNGALVDSNGGINDHNRPGSPQASFDSIVAGTQSPEPTILVSNTYQDASTLWGPDIQVRGDVYNLGGNIDFYNAGGSILQEAKPGDDEASIIDGKQVTITAPNGNVVQAYFDGFKHIAGDPRVNSDPQGHTIAGDKVFINARYVNINGLVQSGIPDWTLTMGAAVTADITDAIADYWSRTGAGRAQHGPLYQLSGFQGDPTGTITAYYNVDTGKIELNGVQVRGGYVDITGEIMSTGNGRIEAMDGYGSIDIENTTGHDIVLNGMGIGDDIEGQVRLTDTSVLDSQGDAVTTRYTRLGDDVQVSEFRDGEWSLVATNSNSRSGGHYSPIDGERYIWKTGTDSTTRTMFRYEDDSIFWFIPSGSVQYTSGPYTIRTGPETPMKEGQYTRVVPAEDRDMVTSSDTYNATGLIFIKRNTYDKCNDFLCFSKTYYVDDYFEQGKKTIKTYSMKADLPIAIQFIGNDTGSVDIDSNSDVFFNAIVDSGNGGLNVTAGNGIHANSALAKLSGDTVTLNAGSGIAGADSLGALVVDAIGAVSAYTTSGDVKLTAPADMLVKFIGSDNGDVMIAVGGALAAVDANATTERVVGDAVSLSAAAGAIGSQAAPLNVQVGNSTDGFSALAQDDIHVRQLHGDFLVNHVESLGGDVWLQAVDGSLVDGNTQEARDTRTEAELLKLWNDMRLLGNGAQASSDDTVAAFELRHEAEYQNYWHQYRNLKAVYDANGAITGYTSDAFDPGFQYQVVGEELDHLRNQLHWTDEQIADYEARQSQEIFALDDLYGDLAYQPDWNYTATGAELATLTEGSVWTENELKYALSGGLVFKQTTDTETRIEDPNVVGRNITLLASGSIGTNDGEILIDGSINTLTDEQRIALASAEADDVSVDNDSMLITVLKREDLDVKAGVSLSASASDHLYLGSEQDINIDSLESGGSIRVKANGGLYNVSAAGDVAISGGGDSVILESANGSIGTANRAMTTDLADGSLLTARGNGIYIDEQDGDLSLAEIFSRGDLYLAADGSLVDARGIRVIALEGNNISLLARRGAIGLANAPLSLAVSAGGFLTGSAATGIYVDSPGRELAVDGLQSTGGTIALNVNGALQLREDSEISAPAVNLDASSLDMGAGSAIIADNTINATTTGDMRLGQLRVTRDASGNVLQLSAGGRIDGNGDGQVNLVGNASNTATIEAGTGIGSESLALAVAIGNLIAHTAQADIHLQLPQGGSLQSVVADAGNIAIGSDGDVEFGRIDASGTLNADVTGHLQGTDLIADGASLNVNASGNVDVDGTLHSSGVASINAGGNMDLATVTVAGALNAQSGGTMKLDTADIGTTADLASAGAMTLGTLSSGSDLTADSAATLDAQQLRVGGNATLTSGDAMHVVKTNIVGALVANSKDALTLDTVDVGITATLNSVGDMTLGSLTSGDRLDANAGGILGAQSLTIGTDANLTSGAAMHLVDTTIAGALNAQSAAEMTLDAANIGSTADLVSGGAMTLGTLSSGSVLSADSTTTLNAQQLTVGGNATLTSGDAMHVVEASIIGALVANSQDALTLDTVDVGTTATLDSIGDTTLGTLTTGDQLDASAGGALSAQSLNIGSDANLTSGAAMHLVDTAVADVLNAQSGAGMTLDIADIGKTTDLVSVGAMTLGAISSGNDLTADSSTTLDAEQLTVGGNATLTSGQAMHVADITVTNALNAQSAAGMTLDTADIGTTADLASVGAMTLGTLSSGGDLAADSATTIDTQTLMVGGNANLTSGDAMHVVEADIVGALVANSQDALTLDTVDVGTTATLDSVGAMTLGSLTSGDRLDGNAGGTLSAQSLTVGTDANLTSGDAMHLVDTTVANAINVQSGAEMTLDTADIGTTSDLVSGGAMTLGTLSSGSDLNADSATTLDAKTLTIGGNANLSSGNAMHLVDTTVAGALNAQSGTDMMLDTVGVGTTANLISGGAMTLGTLSSGSDLNAASTTTLDAQALTIGGNATLASGQAMHVVEAGIVGTLVADSQAALTLDKANVGATATLDSVGDTTLGELVTGDWLDANAGGQLIAQTLVIGSDANLVSGDAMHLVDTTVTGALNAQSGADMTLDTADIGTTADLASVGAMTLGTLSSGSDLNADSATTLDAQTLMIGGDAALVSGDAMHLVDTTVTGALNAQSGAGMTLDIADIGTTADLASVGAMTVGTLSSGGDLTADSATTLEAQTLSVGGNATLSTGQAMHVVEAAIAGALVADSQAALTLDKANVGATATLDSVGDTTLGELATGDWLDANAGGQLIAQTLVIGSDANLVSGDAMHLVDTTVTGALNAQSGADMTLDTADIGTTADLASVGAMTLGTLSSGGDLNADSTTAIDAQTLMIGGNAALNSGDAMHLVDTTVANALNAQSGTDMTLDTVGVGTTATLDSVGAMTLGSLTSGDRLDGNAGGTLSAQSLTVGTDANLNSGDAMHLVDTTVANALNAQSGTDMTLDVAEVAGTTMLDSAASMTIGTLHGVGDIDMTAVDDMRFASLRGDRDILGTSTAGNILGGSARAGRNLKFVAAGDIRFDELQAGTNLDIEAGDDIVGATALALVGSVLAVAGHDMDIQTVKAGLDVGLEAGNAITLGVLEAGRDLGLVAGANIEFGALTVGRNATMQSLRGDISGGSVDAGGSLDANAYRDLTLDTASTGDDMRLHAGRDLHATALVAGKLLDADAGHDLWIQQFRAGDDVHLDSGADMFIGEGDSGGTQYFSVGRNLDFGRLSSATAFFIDVTGGYLDGGELEAPMADLAARDSITLDIARIGERLNLASADIDANVLQTRRDTALFSIITGYHGGVAQRVHLSVDTPQPWMIERLAAVQAAIETTTKQVRIVDGHIENTMRLITPSTNLWMDNQSVALSPADVQMHQINYDFLLDQDDRHTLTDAYVVRYGFGYEVVSPNYLAEHIWLAPNYLGESAMRYTGRTLTEHMAEDDIDPGLTGAQSLEQEDPVRTGLKGAVNVGVAN